jgi:hypothetical protein
MAERARVKKAIEAPVDEAAKLLDELPRGDVETRLTILIEGWGRGLAAGLEELAIAVSDLRRAAADHVSPPPQAPQSAREAETRDEAPSGRDNEPRTADELQSEAARSRAETAALRDASSSSS